MQPDTYAALVAAGLLSVVVFRLLALTRLSHDGSPPEPAPPGALEEPPGSEPG